MIIKKLGEWIWEVSGDEIRPSVLNGIPNYHRKVYGEFEDAEAVRRYVERNADEYLIEKR